MRAGDLGFQFGHAGPPASLSPGVRPMSASRIIFRAVCFGVIAEAVALAVSFGLYSLKQGREPMEPPFNWTATVLQMPGIILSDTLGSYVDYSGWCQWSITFVVQAVLWTAIGFAFLAWRVRKTT